MMDSCCHLEYIVQTGILPTLRTKRALTLMLLVLILIFSLVYYSDEIERMIFEVNIDRYIHLHEYPLSLTPPRACQKGTKVVVIIISSNYHFSQREDIRATWGRDIAQKEDMHPYFIVGLGSREVNDQVERETNTYADIIRYDFVDSYNNLTLKSVSLLKWIERHCPSTDFVVKIDDDFILNITALSELIRRRDDFLLYGRLITGNKRLRRYSDKYFVPEQEFPDEVFPDYLSGACYVMSRKVVSTLLNVSRSTSYLRLEDVFITGICRVIAGLRLGGSEDYVLCTRAP